MHLRTKIDEKPGLLAAGYLLLLGALYHPSYAAMFRMWHRENYTYCAFILPVTGYLLWEKRRELSASPLAPSRGGVLLVLCAALLFWLGELGGEYYLLYLSSWLMVVGLCWLHLGREKTAAIAFPLCFALAAFPLPNVVFDNLSLQLKLLSSRLGVGMLRLCGVEAYREGNVIDLGFLQLQVVEACSGLRYLIPLLILGLLLAYHFRAPFWQKSLVVLSAVPVSVFTNSLRIASVGLLSQVWGAGVAEGFFHDFSGWLIFMLSFALLLAEMWLLRSLSPPPAPRQMPKRGAAGLKGGEKPERVPRRAVPFAVTAFFLGATVAVAHLEPWHEKVPMARPLAEFPMEIGSWHGTRAGIDPQSAEALKLSDSLLADFENAHGDHVSLYVAYHETQRKGESTHSPASCLPGSGWILEQKGTAPLPGKASARDPLLVNRAFVEKGGERMLVYYWFPQRGRALTGMLQLKLYAFWDTLTRRRSDGAMIRVLTPVDRAEEPGRAEARLASFTRSVEPLLQRFIPD